MIEQVLELPAATTCRFTGHAVYQHEEDLAPSYAELIIAGGHGTGHAGQNRELARLHAPGADTHDVEVPGMFGGPLTYHVIDLEIAVEAGLASLILASPTFVSTTLPDRGPTSALNVTVDCDVKPTSVTYNVGTDFLLFAGGSLSDGAGVDVFFTGTAAAGDVAAFETSAQRTIAFLHSGVNDVGQYTLSSPDGETTWSLTPEEETYLLTTGPGAFHGELTFAGSDAAAWADYDFNTYVWGMFLGVEPIGGVSQLVAWANEQSSS